MSKMLALAGLVSALAIGSVALAQTAPVYLVSFDVSDGGKPVGKPRLTVDEGRLAVVSTSGPPAYRIETMIKRNGEQEDMSAKVFMMRNGAMTLVSAPQMTFRPGTAASLSVAGLLTMKVAPLDIKPAAPAPAR